MPSERNCTRFESDLLGCWAKKYAPAVSNQIDDLRVEVRNDTGRGFFTHFDYSRVQHRAAEWPRGTLLILFELKGRPPGGAVVYIESGCVEALEVFSHDDEPVSWDETDYQLDKD
jgi:hypothetical protein